MSRDELSALARAELDALDRILARQPVGEEHLELAALVESVRADAPRMAPASAARLEERVAARRARRPPLARLRGVALAGGGLVAAAVAFTIVIASGVLDTGSGSKAPATRPGTPPAATLHNAAPRPAAPAGSGAIVSLPITPVPAGRLVQRSSTLTLATAPARLPRVADQVVTLTAGAGGVVASSRVSIEGPASRARFSLLVPSARLSPLISSISSLGNVRSLSTVTADVTNAYERVLAGLSVHRAQRVALLRRLARTPAPVPAAAIHRRIAALDALIRADVRRSSALVGATRTVTLRLALVSGAPG